MEDLLNEKKEKTLSKKATLALYLGSLTLLTTIYVLIFLLIYNKKIDTFLAVFLGIWIGELLVSLCNIVRNPYAKSTEERTKKSLKRSTAFTLYSALMLINIALCILLYPLTSESIIAIDFLNFGKSCIPFLLCALSQYLFTKSGMKAYATALFGGSFFIPPIIVCLITAL